MAALLVYGKSIYNAPSSMQMHMPYGAYEGVRWENTHMHMCIYIYMVCVCIFLNNPYVMVLILFQFPNAAPMSFATFQRPTLSS